MDGLPEELLLPVFDAICYNDLRPVLATCVRWRALAQQCRAFWADIQTPDFNATAPNAEVFYRRIECAHGRGFTLHLTGASPDILDAVARAMGQVEHLNVQLDDYAEVQDIFWMLRKVSAPRLRSLEIQLGFASAGVLPDDLFAGTACPLLDRVHLSKYMILSDNPLPCFSGVRDVRLDSADGLHPSVPDFFVHFPSMELLDLRLMADMSPEEMERDYPSVAMRIRHSDWSRLRYLGLRNDSWAVLTGIGCPLQQILHVFADKPDCLSLPFPSSSPLPHSTGHLVVDTRNPEATECVVRLGNADWSASRSAALRTSEIGRIMIKPYDVASASVDCAALRAFSQSFCAPETLRILLLPGDTELQIASGVSLRCAALRTLVFCCPTSGRCARLTWRHVVEFARGYLLDAPFPLQLHLENVALDREEVPHPQFTALFGPVKTRVLGEWGYLGVRAMLDRYDD